MNAEVLAEVNLAGPWEFTPEGGVPTTIQVPGGGWLKQGFSCEAGTYARWLTVPDVHWPQSVWLELGAVNHHAEYFIGLDEGSEEKIHEEVTAFTPQHVDLTPFVRPGQSYYLRIFVRAFQGGRPVAPHWAEWCEWIARGIFRDAWLRVYPDVFIRDVFVRTSVSQRTLRADVWVTNSGSAPRTITLRAGLTSWNGTDWPYPDLPAAEHVVPPRSTIKASLGPVAWLADPESYWWPNVPYREGYRAQLHVLHLYLFTDGAPLHRASVRFGFREVQQRGPFYTLNGVRVNFRGDNLQVANYDRIDCSGRGDAIDTLPGFLPPTDETPGWPQAVDNFLRLNYNVQREHMGPWTPYMLDVCDERGLMLIGESATRWNGFDMENGRGFHEVKCLQDIVRRDRNHPAIVRWSAKNEPQCLDPAYHVELYNAIKDLDDTRPISEDIVITDRTAFDPYVVFAGLLDKEDFTWIEHYLSYTESGHVYFTPIEHNDAVIPLSDRPFGLGEADWMRSSTPAGLTWFATTTALVRAQGASDVRPYVLLSSWASSVPGVRTTDFLTEENRHPVYGEDNLPDPWSHPSIQLLQTANHPLLAFDVAFWRLNRKGDAWGHFPVLAPPLPAAAEVTREIIIFNDEFAGDQLELRWEVREGSPSNCTYASGVVPLRIAPGFMGKALVCFRTPTFNTHIFLILQVWKDGVKRFCDARTGFEIVGGEEFCPELASQED